MAKAPFKSPLVGVGGFVAPAWMQWFNSIFPPVGTNTNDLAPSGVVGEYLTSFVPTTSPVSLTSGSYKTINSLTLTPGDWDLSASSLFVLTGATISQFVSSYSLTTNALGPQAGGNGLESNPYVQESLVLTTITGGYSQTLKTTRLSLAAQSTIYLTASANFSAGTVGASGTISARRAR